MTTSWSGQRRSFPTKMRLAILKRDPICMAAGCTNPSTEADHIINHAECMRLGINPDTLSNGQGLCRDHHWAKTQAEQRQGKQQHSRKRAKPKHPGLTV